MSSESSPEENQFIDIFSDRYEEPKPQTDYFKKIAAAAAAISTLAVGAVAGLIVGLSYIGYRTHKNISLMKEL